MCALLGTINFNWALLSLISPIFQLILEYLQIGAFTKATHKLNLHMNVGLYSTLFFSIHSITHVVNAIQYPLVVNSFGELIYIWNSPAIISGSLLVGIILIMALFGRTAKTIHVGLSIITCTILSIHGYEEILGIPLGNYITLSVLSFSFIFTSTFRITNPAVNLKVIRHECSITKGETNLFLLILENDYLLATRGTYLISLDDTNYFLSNGSVFPAFSNDPEKLCFYFEVTYGSQSFTQKLSEGIMDGTINRYYFFFVT